MKHIKRIIVVIILLLGSFLIFKTSNKRIIKKYDITKDYEEIISIKPYKDYVYILTTKSSNNKNNTDYRIIKYNIKSSYIKDETSFNVMTLLNPVIDITSSNIDITSSNGETLRFNNRLQDIKKITNKVPSNIPSVCKEDNVTFLGSKYIVMNNSNVDITCVYNEDGKTIDYFDTNNVIPFDNGYLTFKNNEVTIKKEIKEVISINFKDIKINKNGTSLLTISDSNELVVYDLTNKTILNKLKLNINDNEFISLLYIDSLVYYIVTDGIKSYMYTWDYKDKPINDKIISIKEYTKVDNYYLASKIKNDFNVNINIYENSINTNEDYYTLPLLDNNKIYNSLTKVYEVFTSLSKEFMKDFNSDIELYLSDKIISKELTKPNGYSLLKDNKYIIAIDTNSTLESTLYHELMHIIENKMSTLNPFSKWNKLNPKNFKYNNSYTDEMDNRYTISSNEDIYFIDSYSKTYESEDRARIFETICTSNSLKNYPHIEKKAKYLREEILKVYPNLKILVDKNQ